MVPPLKRSFEFEITTAQQADSIVEALNEQERQKLLDALNKKMRTNKEKKESQKKESKETLTKSLEFEEDTFKIDSKGWKEEKRKIYGEWKIKVKVNATWDVVEYLEWLAKWEQIFITYDAFIREVMKAKNCSKEEVEQKYLMTDDELEEKMKDKPSNSEEYKKFFTNEVKDHLAGFWGPRHEKFLAVGDRFNVWLAGGHSAVFMQNKWGLGSNNRFYGFSGRLLKNKN